MYLEALTEYPLNISVKPIVDLVGWRLKRRISPYMDSCFEIACDELGIAPIKSLRREYKKDGRVFLLCKFNKCVETCRKYQRNDVFVARFIKSMVEEDSSE